MSNEIAELGRCEEPKITAARYAGQRRSALTDLHLPPKFPASPNRISGAEDQVREEGDASGAHALPDESGTTLGATHGAQARPGIQVSGPGHRGLPRRRPSARPGRPQGAHPRQQRGAAQVPIGGGGEEAWQDLGRSRKPFQAEACKLLRGTPHVFRCWSNHFIVIPPTEKRVAPTARDALWWLGADAWAMERAGGSMERWASMYGYPLQSAPTARLSARRYGCSRPTRGRGA